MYIMFTCPQCLVKVIEYFVRLLDTDNWYYYFLLEFLTINDSFPRFSANFTSQRRPLLQNQLSSISFCSEQLHQSGLSSTLPFSLLSIHYCFGILPDGTRLGHRFFFFFITLILWDRVNSVSRYRISAMKFWFLHYIALRVLISNVLGPL